MAPRGKTIDLAGYGVRLSPLSKEDGGGWFAEVPELDGCISDGETPEEALVNVQDAIECWLDAARESGTPIPTPALHEEPGYSGKFTLRVPRTLHRLLVRRAEREGVSLNQYILALISYNLGHEDGRDPEAQVGLRSAVHEQRETYE